MTAEQDKLMEEAVRLRDRSLTDQQRQRKEHVEARNKRLQEGIKQPASGIFGGKLK